MDTRNFIMLKQFACPCLFVGSHYHMCSKRNKFLFRQRSQPGIFIFFVSSVFAKFQSEISRTETESSIFDGMYLKRQCFQPKQDLWFTTSLCTIPFLLTIPCPSWSGTHPPHHEYHQSRRTATLVDPTMPLAWQTLENQNHSLWVFIGGGGLLCFRIMLTFCKNLLRERVILLGERVISVATVASALSSQHTDHKKMSRVRS